MVVTPDKFQASDDSYERITIDNQEIRVVSSVKLLGLQLDNNLNFNQHIRYIYKSATNQLNALIGLYEF